MSILASAWQRVPVVIRAVIVGTIVAAVATYPWAWLAAANTRHLPTVPWGPLVMAVYLWCYWWYVTGRGRPASTSAFRRRNARVRAVSSSAFGAAMIAGIFGLWSSVALLRLIGRLSGHALGGASGVGHLSAITIAAFVLMGSIVAGVAEEIAFRGYMQRPIEQRYGPVAAILTTGIMFGLAHGGHTYWSLALMPYYLAVGAVYGTMTYLTDSVVPSLTLHAVGDALDGLLAVSGGGSAGASSSSTGPALAPEAALILNVAVIVITAAIATWAFRALASTVREEHAGPAFARGIAGIAS